MNGKNLRAMVTEILALVTSGPLLRCVPQEGITTQQASAGGAQTNGTSLGDGLTFYDDVNRAVAYTGGMISHDTNIFHTAGEIARSESEYVRWAALPAAGGQNAVGHK